MLIEAPLIGVLDSRQLFVDGQLVGMVVVVLPEPAVVGVIPPTPPGETLIVPGGALVVAGAAATVVGVETVELPPEKRI